MRAYEALGDFLKDDPELLARCRDFGIKLGYEENSPEWSYLVMPAMILRETQTTIATQMKVTVRETVTAVLAEKSAISETNGGTYNEKARQADLASLIRASKEIMIPLKAGIETLNAREQHVTKLTQQLEACVNELKKVLGKVRRPSLLERLLQRA